MKTHTSGFKENVKLFGRQLDSKITYTYDNEEIELGSEELNSVSPHYEGSILKSVMRQLDIDSNVEIPIGVTVNYQFGVKVGNYNETTDETYQDGINYYSLVDNDYILLIKGTDYNIGDNIIETVYNYFEEYEYINFGNYMVKDVEKQEDTRSWKITCYDKMLYSMVDYTRLDITYPITIRNYISAICTKLGLTFKDSDDEFVNYNKEIEKELYLDYNGNSLDYTFRDVLDELAQVTASTICINEDDDELEIRYINDTEDTIDEEYLKDINVNFGEKFGAVNTIVFSRSAGADKITKSNPENLEDDEKITIEIVDNQILNGNNRDEFIDGILNELYGFEYYINDFSSTGITYYNLCDKYNIEVGETTYSCIMFNDEINITQGLEENIHTDLLEESKTDYTKTDKTDRRINQTWIIADKNAGNITALTSRTEILETEMGDRYTKEQTNELVQNAATGVTNTFSEAGGNNIFHNTGLWFEGSGTEEKEASSTSGVVHVTDATTKPIQEINLDGKCEQNSWTSRNLFNRKATPIYTNSANVSTLDTGVKVISTYSSSSGGFYVAVYKIMDVSNYVGQTFTLKANFTVSASNNGRYAIGLCDADGNNRKTGVYTSTSGEEITYTIPSLETATYLAIWLYSNAGNRVITGDYVDYTNVQLEIGDTSTEYEPYTAGQTSNPDYPERVKSISGIGNLFDMSQLLNATDWTKNADGYYTGTALNLFNAFKTNGFSFPESFKENTQYTISCVSYSNNTNSGGRLQVTYTDNTTSNCYIGRKTTDKYNSHTTIANKTISNITFNYSNGHTLYIKYIQVEEGTTAHNYFQYGYWLPIKVQNKNLFDKNNQITLDKSYTSVGNITSTEGSFIQESYIPVKPNTAYTISTEVISSIFRICEYASDKTFIEIKTTTDDLSYTFTTTSTTNYIRISGITANINTMQLEIGLTVTDYITHQEQNALINLNTYSGSTITGHYEICSIGDVKDTLKIENGRATLTKNIDKIVYNGTEEWGRTTNTGGTYKFVLSRPSNSATQKSPISNYFKGTSSYATNDNSIYIGNSDVNISRVVYNGNYITTTADFKTWLSTHNTDVYYKLGTTQTITLNGTYNLETYQGENYITIENDDLTPDFDMTYLTKFMVYDFWEGNVKKLREEKSSSQYALLLKNGTLWQSAEVPNGNYTISFKYKKLINLANPKVIINDIEYLLNETDDTEFLQSIVVNAQNIKVSFVTDIDDSCEIYDLMVNAGTVKLAYSQNQNETITDTVNISKGITITSNISETTFKANSDGIRTLDKNENILTEFTDTGMTTKKMIVEDESELVGLLIQEVGDQTWFTRM